MDIITYIALRSFDSKNEANAIENALSYSAEDMLIVDHQNQDKHAYVDQKTWLYAFNPKTNAKGFVRAEYIRRFQSHELLTSSLIYNSGSQQRTCQSLVKAYVIKPLFCGVCKDYIWGTGKIANICQGKYN